MGIFRMKYWLLLVKSGYLLRKYFIFIKIIDIESIKLFIHIILLDISKFFLDMPT